MTRRPVGLAVSALVLAVLAGCLPGGSSEESDAKRVSEELPRVPAMVVLDASGSMKDDDAPGVRFVAAQKAVRSLIGALSDEHEIGLVAYGTSTGSADDEAAAGCRDIETVVPFGKLDKKAFTAAVDGLEPSGYTPIGESLKQAAAALPTDVEDVAIVLVSDGVDSCLGKKLGPDPCEVAKDLKADRPGLAINTVGFKIADDPEAREQLSCIAESTGGLDLDAVNAELLATRFLAAFDPARAASSLQPSGYRGLVPGMSIEEARQAAPKLGKVSGEGELEIVYIDCTVVFDDGVLVAIIPSGQKVKTLEGIGIGTDVAEAEKLYGDPGVPTPREKNTVTYSADLEAGSGYRITFEPSSDGIAGKITRIVLCRCGPVSIIRYGDEGVTIQEPSDVDQLVGAPDSFKQFMLRLLEDGPNDEVECELPYLLTIDDVDPRGLAIGTVNECGGYQAVWGTDDGQWRELYGTQFVDFCPEDLGDFTADDVIALQPICTPYPPEEFASTIGPKTDPSNEYATFIVAGGDMACDLYGTNGLVFDEYQTSYLCTQKEGAALANDDIPDGDVDRDNGGFEIGLDCGGALSSTRGQRPQYMCRGGVEGDFELAQSSGGEGRPNDLADGRTVAYNGVTCTYEAPELSCRTPSTRHGFTYDVSDGDHDFF